MNNSLKIIPRGDTGHGDPPCKVLLPSRRLGHLEAETGTSISDFVVDH